MKQIALIFNIIILILGCAKSTAPQTVSVTESIPVDSELVLPKDDFLFIGGEEFDGYRKSDIPTIERVSLYIDPRREG
ncbi:hypothetical protein AGMMS49579_24420 [Spirochaetia bacterium]|nr:hypothetical protein AGMMS49579_24420 [Spirochaetia bacterium]